MHPEKPSKPQQVADYIRELTAELAKMAHKSHLEGLAHLLEVTSLEAQCLEQGRSSAFDRAHSTPAARTN